MTLENNATADQFARWLLLRTTVQEIVKERLVKECVQRIAEIDEQEDKVFMTECENCETPKITHVDLSGTSCDVIDCGQTTQDILKTLIATQEGKENFSLAII